MKTTLPKVESTEDAAARIGCSRPTVVKLVKEGAIAGIRFGRSIRVLSESVDTFILKMLWDSYCDAIYTPDDPDQFERDMIAAGIVTRENIEK